MARFLTITALLFTFAAYAGDEDVAPPKPAVEEKTPEDTPIPKEQETPELSVGDGTEPTPDFEEIKPKDEAPAPPPAEVEAEEEPKVAPAAPKRIARDDDPDHNIDYSRLLDSVEALDPGRGVLAPALGFRGYRPSMVAVGGGDRVPGFGAMVEYSWNRIGAGVCASYRSTKGEDANVIGYGLMGAYGLYRWLPFDMSPYILMGLEAGSQTDEFFGGMLGGGVEWRVYQGWTLLFGWTYHSTVHRGFLGGAIGWSF